MTAIPFLPLWVLEYGGGLAIILFTFLAWRHSQRLMDRDPENALWLFFNWLAMALVIFAWSHFISHFVQDLIRFRGASRTLDMLRRLLGGIDSIVYVAIATITLFFHRMRRLYQRMEEDHHHMEETSHEILALNREMEALVMERTMSEMALGIAHGIRNPLHIIGGFSHRLLKKTNPNDPTRDWLKAITQEAKRIEDMVERFETLAQRKSSFFAPEDLNEIVQATLTLIKPEVRAKNIFLIVELHPEPLMGRLNTHLLKVAVAHLMRNAIEASSPRSTILVQTRQEKHFAVLMIQDTGRGMPPEVVDKVFVPFYTTKIGGTGLGMVFVRQIVDEHRGVITLESKLGRGTTVTIRLPLRFIEAPGVTEPEPAPPTPAGEPEKNLISTWDAGRGDTKAGSRGRAGLLGKVFLWGRGPGVS
ncbi:MAG: sensor histidine kinase, partial [Desulfobaccales bacterium]